MRKNNSFIYIIPILFLLGTAIYCPANAQKKQESYRDIFGYWQEYILNSGAKEKTSIRKITLNTEGNLTQSITYEMAPQCRIWLNDDDISFKNGRLDFWGGEFSGEMSDDKNSVLLTYKQMSNPFLLERIRDKKTIELIDRIEASQGKEYAYYILEQTGDGWECVNLEDLGLNKKSMIDCVNQIRKGKYKDIHSLLIVKNGKLAFEEYFGAEGTLWSPFLNQVLRDRIQMLASVTKSVNSALIGIAVEKGIFPSIQDPAFELFPEYAPLLDAEKNKILIEHLLTMSAGLEWNELDVPYSDPQNDVNQIIPKDWVKDSTRIQIKKTLGGYGYQWWMRSFKAHGKLIDAYYALGRAGQFIMVFPALDLIVVSTAQNYDYGWSTRFYNLVHKYILQAVMPVSKN